MGTKFLSFFTLAFSLVTTVMLIIVAFVPTPETLGQMATLTLCMAGAGMFLLALRFNVTALRHDMTDRMAIPNVGLIFVSLFLLFIFIRHFVFMPEMVTYIVLGGLVACFAIVFIAYWVVRRRSY